MPKSRNGYISLALPPGYLMAILPDVPEAPLRTPPVYTYSKTDLDYLFKPLQEISQDDRSNVEQVHKDLPRTSWAFGKNAKGSSGYGSLERGPESTLTAMQAKSSEEGSRLTRDEAAALNGFASTAGEKDALQGGFFHFPESTIHLWLQSIGDISAKESTSRITRSLKGDLNILYEINFYRWMDQDKVNYPLIIYNNEYTMEQSGENFTLTRLNNPESCNVLFEENFFNQAIIPAALNKLANSDFNENDLTLFTPLLSDLRFAQAFLKKLQSSPASPETMKLLWDKVTLCFGLPTFWQRHQGKISLSTVGVIIVAAITTAIVLTVGLPAVLAAVGGALLFSAIVVGATLAVAATGALVGTDLDRKRTFVFDTLKQMGEVEKDNEIKLLKRRDSDSETLTTSSEGEEKKVSPAPSREPSREPSPSPTGSTAGSSTPSPNLTPPPGSPKDITPTGSPDKTSPRTSPPDSPRGAPKNARGAPVASPRNEDDVRSRPVLAPAPPEAKQTPQPEPHAERPKW